MTHRYHSSSARSSARLKQRQTLAACLIGILALPGIGLAKTYEVKPGESIQAAIDGAAPGDRITLEAGVHQPTATITVDKALTIRGEKGKAASAMDSVIDGGNLSPVIRIDAGKGSRVDIRDMQLDADGHGVQHLSGDFALRNCRVLIRTTTDFVRGVLLQGKLGDTVDIKKCYLLAEFAANAPDVDLILCDVGSVYEEVTVRDCTLINEIPNAISVGIEGLNSLADRIVIRGNDISSQGYGIGIFNSTGTFDIRNNLIWSGTLGISVSSSSLGSNRISGNTIHVEDLGLDVFPIWIRGFVAQPTTAGIYLGSAGATVTEAFGWGDVVPLVANCLVKNNVLGGNPQYGIAMVDSIEPEPFLPTPNLSHDNLVTRNDLTDVDAICDIALGESTSNNLVIKNLGVDTLCDDGENH